MRIMRRFGVCKAGFEVWFGLRGDEILCSKRWPVYRSVSGKSW